MFYTYIASKFTSLLLSLESFRSDYGYDYEIFIRIAIESRHILAPSRTNGIRIVVVTKMTTKFVTNHVVK